MGLLFRECGRVRVWPSWAGKTLAAHRSNTLSSEVALESSAAKSFSGGIPNEGQLLFVEIRPHPCVFTLSRGEGFLCSALPAALERGLSVIVIHLFLHLPRPTCWRHLSHGE